ncbi:heme/hemin ABC transporter substrate-binding protein [Pseudogemmobacter sonorensis]|uniref:heme/hemin ABC transporter substrate-binding protein n=1 Tax=Pseudogemmobacter sonorensis TaxID=2989681 RepID=UPI0036BD8BEB
MRLVSTAILGLWAAAAPALAESYPEADRIVSIGGSVTEIVVELGAEARLIARDTTSNHPASILELPDVGYIRALSPEGVLALDPDLIISEQGAGPVEAVEVLRSAGIPFIEMPGDPTPAGIATKIRAVGETLGLSDRAEALAVSVTEGLAAAEARAEAVTGKKRVLFVLAIQSGRVMAGGTGTAAEGIIELAGGTNAGTGFAGYKQMTDEAVLEANPDVILMMNREGDLQIANDDILSHPALSQTLAAETGLILRMDGMLMLGFGPRTPAAADELYGLLYPGAPEAASGAAP